MKTFTKSLSGLLSASTLAIALSVIAQPAAAAGIAASAHNLANATDTATTTTQICVFCHTPHGANTAVQAPLWNKALPNSTYTMYTSATMDGSADRANLTVSLACLSCHDGTQARDNMINKPGTGGYNATGSSLNSPAMSNMTDLYAGQPSFAVANLGVDLSNDHPIGMGYCGSNSAFELVNGMCPDDSFSLTTGGTEATRMWVESGTQDGVYTKSDFPLYGGSSAIGAGVIVECATCHDPHTPTNGTFLRVSNARSALCLTCHTK